MEARIKEEIKVYKPIELALKKEKEAEILWVLLNMPDNIFEDILEEFPGLRSEDGTIDVALDMFHDMRDVLEKVFTPKWYKDC